MIRNVRGYNTSLVIQSTAEQFKYLMYLYSMRLHITVSSMFIIPLYWSCNVPYAFKDKMQRLYSYDINNILNWEFIYNSKEKQYAGLINKGYIQNVFWRDQKRLK